MGGRIERETERKKRKKEGKKAKFILDLGFEVWIYISKHCGIFQF